MPPTNRTAADARAPFSRTLGELLVEQASRSPEHPAVIQGEPVTFADLAGRAGALAAGLRELGVRRGDRVAALVGNRVEFLEVLFGATTLGAIVVPLSTWSTRTELEFLLHATRARRCC